MTLQFDPAMPLGERRPWRAPGEALADRVRMVLETRPGQIPWRPEFGCDLDDISGHCATPQLISYVEWKVRGAVGRWLKDVKVKKCQVQVVNSNQGARHRTVPAAEAALMSVGSQANLVVALELQGPDGPASLTATLN